MSQPNVELQPKLPESLPPSPPPYTGWQASVANYFHFERYRTNFRTEILAGLTTFMTVAYILAVHPLIMSDAVFL